MIASAPGKLLLSGAYAVLEGAPAIVCAVNRYARAGGPAGDDVPAEVRAAMDSPPRIDTSELEISGRKLGLGSSAAALVAALALRAAESGEDVTSASVRSRLFARARAVHAQVQHGGSGVDVAASVYGGVLRYRAVPDVQIDAVALPPSLHLAAFFAGASARTSELRARVDALRERDRGSYDRAMAPVHAAALAAHRAMTDANAFVTAIAAAGRALAVLGAAADAPIVPAAFAELAILAECEHAAFAPSGAGGGDVGIFVGTQGPSPSFIQGADRLGMLRVAFDIDRAGVVSR